jgi:uncharacterized protein YdaL
VRPSCSGGPTTLILYDTTGAFGYLGELYAIQAANLVGHFGPWTAKPVAAYAAGELFGHAAAVYLGSTYDEPIPTAFLDDVLAERTPVFWMYHNIWQLTARSPDFEARYGWMWSQYDLSAVSTVVYKGVPLARSTTNPGGIMDYLRIDTSAVTVLATAVRPDTSTFPWGLLSRNLSYLGEMPFAYTSEEDRYLIFADLLFDLLDTGGRERHRALVRIEDVGPESSPDDLRAAADYLAGRGVPFSVAVFPHYRDPLGAEHDGVPTEVHLRDRPEIVSALRYMLERGGTLVLHGLTHQHADSPNPYDAASGNDFEFFLAHIDAQDFVVLDGPVAEDSPQWAAGRMRAALCEVIEVGLPAPRIFEFPHYAGSAIDYATAAGYANVRYERALFFGGLLSVGSVDATRFVGQFFPYVVRDVYGTTVLPENLGNYAPLPYNNNPPRFPADLIDAAAKNLVVRDGFASFFYHPYFGVSTLAEIVEGIEALGYTFVSPDDLF